MITRLGDLVKIRTGKLNANASSENGQYPFFTCSEEPLLIDSYSYDCECVLVAGNGALNVKYYYGKFDAYQRTYIIESLNKNILDVRYLYYFLSSYIDVLREKSIGGIIKYIKLNYLTEAEIRLPSLNEQKKIVEKMDLLSSIIAKNSKVCLLHDNLIKSQFIEMFGDMEYNSNNYPISFLGNLFDIGSSKRVYEKDWKTEGVPFYRAREVVKLAEDGFVNNSLFISTEMYSEYSKKYGVPQPGDILCTGVGTLGICYLVQPNDKFYYKDGNIICFHNKGLFNSRFLVECFKMPFIKNQIRSISSGSTVGTYTIVNACKTKIPVPPLDKQDSFEQLLNQIDKSKFRLKELQSKLEILYKSLLQKYFG